MGSRFGVDEVNRKYAEIDFEPKGTMPQVGDLVLNHAVGEEPREVVEIRNAKGVRLL